MDMQIAGFPDYTVSRNGDVFSRKCGRFLKHNISKGGYHSVELFNEHGHKRLLVHRLVAMAYLPNPENLPQVNHISEDKGDNSVSNLEWCDAKYNMNYGTRIHRKVSNTDYSTEKRKQIARINGKAKARPVLQVADGKIVNRFNNAKDASVATGIDHSHILDVCNGKRKTAGGFVWTF